MAEKTAKAADAKLGPEQTATRNAALAPQCPAVGTNQTVAVVRRRKVRYQRKQTYHYHHAP